MTDIVSVVEFFNNVVGKHPSKVSKEKFDKVMSLYEDRHDNVEFFFTKCDNTYLVSYVCPTTGEIIRERKATKYELAKIDPDSQSLTKQIEDVSLLDEVDELSQHYNGYKTLVDGNTVEILSKMDKHKSAMLHNLIEHLVAGNAGVITFGEGDSYKKFMRIFKELKDGGLVVPVDNGLKKTEHFSYRLAPYLAYKGSSANRESALQSWFREQARITAKSIATGVDPNGEFRYDFPYEPPLSHPVR